MMRSFFLSLARTAIAAALLVGALLPSGCTTTSSPTLPIPPPEALSSAPDAEGFVTIEGDGAIEGAQVLAYNEQLELGVIGVADDMGRFTLRLRAEVGHTILVWQRLGTESGQLRTLIVPRE